MSLIENERTKLLATALNTAATSCFTVGIATPLAGYLYNVSGFRSQVAPWELALGVGCWLIAAGLPTLGSEAGARKPEGMNEYFILAFIITPTVVVVLGWAAVLLHEWDLRRRRSSEPGE
jgi:uncharacterized membrane protein YhdT